MGRQAKPGFQRKQGVGQEGRDFSRAIARSPGDLGCMEQQTAVWPRVWRGAHPLQPKKLLRNQPFRADRP